MTGVRTASGDIEAEIVVNCAGQWAKQVGAWCGVSVPLHSCEHFYVVTEQIDGVHRDLPILRDPDGYTYFKEEVGGLVVGGFEPNAKPWVAPDALPYPFEFQLLPEDWDHFSLLADEAQRRVPALRTTGIKKMYNGPESFTPDNQFLIGEAPECRNFFVAAGFNSVGIASAGGAGQALAQWILTGDPGIDLTATDIRRFAPFHGNNRWLRDRVGEILGLHYALPWPNRELATARPFRRSPVHHLLEAAGACFGSRMGWERPNFFALPGDEPVIEYSWGAQNWLPACAAEQRAARRDVALFDQTSFSKYLLTGPDAEQALQWLCTADVAVEPGWTVYTGMLNERGTYESDLTVTRASELDFLLVSSAATTERDKHHITLPDARRRPGRTGGRDLGVRGVRRDGAAVARPARRAVRRRPVRRGLPVPGQQAGQPRLLHRPGDPDHLRRRTGLGAVRAVRVRGRGVRPADPRPEREFGLVNAGYYAIESMRLEKGYRAYGRELTPDYGPVEAGLGFACKLRTDISFLGREAVEKARAEGPRRRLVSLVASDPGAMMWGGELVLRDGVPVGQVTSAAWGAALGATAGLAYVWDPAATR